jgi:hypothetical protein
MQQVLVAREEGMTWHHTLGAHFDNCPRCDSDHGHVTLKQELDKSLLLEEF